MAENYDDDKVYFQGNPDLLFNVLTFPHKKKLEKGVYGPNIVILQKLLEDAGFYQHKVKYKWTYDDSIAEAVKKFQESKKLTVDGIADTKTIIELNTAWYNKRGGLPFAYYFAGFNTVTADSSVPWNTDDYTKELKVHVEFLHNTVDYDLDMIDIERIPWGYDAYADIRSLSYNIDIEAFSAEANVKIAWYPEMECYTSIGQAARLTLKSQKDQLFYVLVGYVSNIKIEQSDNETWATYTIKQTNILDTEEIWDYNLTQSRGDHLMTLTTLTNIDINYDLEGMDNSVITLTTISDTNTENTTTSTTDGTSTATKTVSECFDMAKSFIHPSHDRKYQTGSSTHDPETAWKAYQNGTRHFDCFGCSAFLFYVISNFAKKAVRVIHRYSASAGSGTHYTVQLKNDAGEWYDPRDEYRKLDSFLRVNSGPILQVHQVYEG